MTRQPCTCRAGAPRCPACAAWDAGVRETADREQRLRKRIVEEEQRILQARGRLKYLRKELARIEGREGAE